MLDELEKLAKEATPGPWSGPCGYPESPEWLWICRTNYKSDIER